MFSLSFLAKWQVNYALGALYYLCYGSFKEEILKPEVVELIEKYAATDTSVSFRNLANAFLDAHVKQRWYPSADFIFFQQVLNTIHKSGCNNVFPFSLVDVNEFWVTGYKLSDASWKKSACLFSEELSKSISEIDSAEYGFILKFLRQGGYLCDTKNLISCQSWW